MFIYTPPPPCIYKITNHVTGKVYIGSTFNVIDRQYNHTRELLKNKHHSIKLQNSWNKHNWKAFSFQIIELVDDVIDLLAREQYYIEFYDSIKNGYNIYNPEKRSENDRGYHETIESIKVSKKKYRDANKEKAKQYYKDNKERISNRKKQYNADNKDILYQQRKNYREANKDVLRENKRIYREANKDKIKQHKKEWYEAKKKQEILESLHI